MICIGSLVGLKEKVPSSAILIKRDAEDKSKLEGAVLTWTPLLKFKDYLAGMGGRNRGFHIRPCSVGI